VVGLTQLVAKRRGGTKAPSHKAPRAAKEEDLAAELGKLSLAGSNSTPVPSLPSLPEVDEASTVYVVLDTNAVVAMLTLAAHAKGQARQQLFSFEALLSSGAARCVQLVVPHTVGVELDGLKGSKTLNGASLKALRAFLADYGLRQKVGVAMCSLLVLFPHRAFSHDVY
jgi:hypothetical protein